MKKVKYRIFAADFETTVYEGQTKTEVWSSALVELNTEQVLVHHSIEETFDWLVAQDTNIMLYYHNLKFDGSFWLDFILNVLHFEQALEKCDNGYRWVDDDDMKNNSFKYMISNRGQWYSITIKINGKYIVLRDSVKLVPFSLEALGKAFDTKHKKLKMEYKGLRYAGCEITDEEMEYIKNDVLVLKEVLEFMFKQGHKKSTIGSNCLAEFEKTMDGRDLKVFFPNLKGMELDSEKYGASDVDEYVRKSYRGGWCYAVEEKAGKVFGHGVTADVNSLYPSMMHSDSGNAYPIGKPKFWSGNFMPKETERENMMYFVRIRCRFELKKGYLPFIQIKNSPYYKPTEMLRTSDYVDESGKKYRYLGEGESKVKMVVELTLTKMDYELFLEHYDVFELEILDGCCFWTIQGIFDSYINKYREIKMNSKGAMRTLAKLFLNNLYGKMASSSDSSFKIAYIREDGSVGFIQQEEHEKECGYIPIGSAITSYARNFTIRAAQKNYHGVSKPGFIYADTDSIHCDLNKEDLVGVPVHPNAFNHWSIECEWDEAIFARQKTYIEHVVIEDGEKVDPTYSITCAGMPQKCKNLLVKSMTEDFKDNDEYTEDEREFLKERRSIKDFSVGLKVPGKLMPKRIPGGTLLVDTTYEMR